MGNLVVPFVIFELAATDISHLAYFNSSFTTDEPDAIYLVSVSITGRSDDNSVYGIPPYSTTPV